MAMKWRKSPEALVRTFDAIVPDDPRVERRKMFGYPAAFVGGNLFMSLFQDSLVLRLPEDDRVSFLRIDGSAAFEPMPGRPMREYVVAPPALVARPRSLASWIERSLAYAQSIPPKAAKRSASRAPATRRAPTAAKRAAAQRAAKRK
ncbi:MAG TPA: TfoX/Sxy family protein [bacterium]|nr:TfoX/Sxy family protein [bacterium]